MALIQINENLQSNLLFKEVDTSAAYSRRIINISSTDTEVPMGTVVSRAAGDNQEAPYTVLANATTLVVEGKPNPAIELAVVFGDKYDWAPVFTTASEGLTKAHAFVRGEVQLKDYLIMQNLGIEDRESDEYQALKTILENQGVIIERTLGA